MGPGQLGQLDLLEVVADVAPGVAAGLLGHALDEQGQHGQEHMGLDALGGEVEHRAHPQPALELAPGLLDAHELLVAQRQVLGRQRVVVAVHDELAVVLLGGAHRGAVDAQLAGAGATQVAPVAAAGEQAHDALGLRAAVRVAERCQLGFQLGQQAGAVLALSRLLGRVVTDHVTAPALAVPDDDLLDPQVLCDLAVPAGAVDNGLAHFGARTDGHAYDVLAATQAQRAQVLGADHAGIAHEHAAAQAPAPEVLLDLLDRGDVHGIAAEDPVPHRQAVARHREPDHDLRRVAAPVLGVAALAQHPFGAGLT